MPTLNVRVTDSQGNQTQAFKSFVSSIVVNEPRPANAIFLTDDIASRINAGSTGQQFVIAAGEFTLSQTITLKPNMGVWGERQADLLPITESYADLGTPNTQAKKVRPSTILRWPTALDGFLGNKKTGQQLVDLECIGGTHTGGPGTWEGGHTIENLWGAHVRRCKFSFGTMNCVGNLGGLMEDCELHDGGQADSGHAAALLKTVQPLTVRRTFAHNGFRNGFWADCGTTDHVIEDCFVVDISKSGLFYEISQDGFIARRTTVWRCNQSDVGDGAGIRFVSSIKGLVEGCDLRGSTQQDLLLWNDSRSDRQSTMAQCATAKLNAQGCNVCGFKIAEFRVRNSNFDPARTRFNSVLSSKLVVE